MSVTSHRDGEELQDPQVEPDLDQHEGPDQQHKVDIAGSLGALHLGEEGAGDRAGGTGEPRGTVDRTGPH